MIFCAGTDVPKDWYKAEYDKKKYPNFEFKFIKDCHVRKAHDIVFIKAVDGKEGNVMELNNVDDCKISFPFYFIEVGSMEENIETYGKYRLH